MGIYKRVISVVFIWVCFLLLLLFGCGYRPEYFSEEELIGYRSPIVFCESREDGRQYFMMLDDPDYKVFLEYNRIWDYDPADQTFLFSMTENEEEGIYEYDLQDKSYKCLIDEPFLSQHLQISDEEELESVYYRVSSDEISGVYGDILFIYNKMDSEFTYTMHLPDVSWGTAFGWLDANTFLFEDFDTLFELNIKTEEMKELGNDFGNSIYLSADKTVGCSAGDENWFGASYSPILFWDTTNYNIKKFHEGIVEYTHIQISDDHKFILFARGNGDENDQLLCIRIEDEKLCVVYETEDNILDTLW